MTRINWVSNGRPLEYVFLRWLRDTPKLIIPNFHNIVFPSIRFTDKRELVTLNWEDRTFRYNVNKQLFPNVETVYIVGDTKPPPYSYMHYELVSMKYYYNKSNQVQWIENEWVNEEWLKSQFNEFFARSQQIYQNELRKQLK